MVEPHDPAEGDEKEKGQQQVYPNGTMGRHDPRREDGEPGDDRRDVPAPDRAQQVALVHEFATVEFDGSGNCKVRGQLTWRRPPVELGDDVEHSGDDEDGTGADHRAVKLEDIKGVGGDPDGGSRVLTQVAAINPFLEALRFALDLF